MGGCTSTYKIYSAPINITTNGEFDNGNNIDVRENGENSYVDHALENTSDTIIKPYYSFPTLCKYGPEDICVDFLENNINECNLYLETWNVCFNDACENNMDRICETMLRLYPKCIQSNVLFGETPLILACRKKKENICIQIIDILQGKSFEKIDQYGFTALMYACKYNLVTVATKILQFPTKCEIHYENEQKLSAMTYAKQNRMNSIIVLILSHTSESDKKILLTSYIEDPIFQMLNNKKYNVLINLDEMNRKIDSIRKYNTELKNSCNVSGCLVCFEETSDSYYLNCHHTIKLCVCCMEEIKCKSCPVCRECITLCERAYVV